MPILKAIYESADEIPETFAELYTERDGKFELTGIEGVKTEADVARLDKALKAERAEHSKTKGRVKSFGDLTPEAVEEMRSQIETLTAQVEAGGKPDEAAMEKLIAAKLPAHLKPLQRELKEAIEARDALAQENQGLKGDKIRRGLSDLVRITLGTKKMAVVDRRAEADIELWTERVMTFDEDGRFVTKEGVGLTPGMSLEEALLEVQSSGTRPLWFKGNTPSGAQDGDSTTKRIPNGENPFDDESWNLTKASEILQKNPGEAKRLARSAKKNTRAKGTFKSLFA